MRSSFLPWFCISYLLLLAVGSLAVVVVSPRSLIETDMQNVLGGFSPQSLLGTDVLGRDLFFRCLYGVYISLMTGIFSVLLAFFIGLTVGAFTGYIGSWPDRLIARGLEIISALPNLVVMAILYLILESNLPLKESPVLLLVLVLGLSSWMTTARFIRNLILKEKVELYVESARAVGARNGRILFRHILPNIASSLIIFVSLQIPQALMAEGLLSFLGFGIHSPQISLGSLLQDGWKTMSSFPVLLVAPGLILFMTVFSIYYLLDQFRIQMDPKLKWERFS
jgi:oligopeptide transport system permease protein